MFLTSTSTISESTIQPLEQHVRSVASHGLQSRVDGSTSQYLTANRLSSYESTSVNKKVPKPFDAHTGPLNAVLDSTAKYIGIDRVIAYLTDYIVDKTGDTSYLYRHQAALFGDKKRIPYQEITLPRLQLSASLTLATHRKSDNGHAFTGSCRDTFLAMARTIAASNGYQLLHVNPSNWQLLPSEAAITVCYTPIDAGVPTQPLSPQLPPLITMIDVDYYIEDWSPITTACAPIILYTFAPTVVAHSGKEHGWCCDGTNFTVSISGGNTWKHAIWNWTEAGEFLALPANKSLTKRRWVIYKVAVYRPFPDPNRAFVYLHPWVTTTHKPHDAVRFLQRVNYTDKRNKDWVSLHNMETDTVSLAPKLGRVNLQIPYTLYFTLPAFKTLNSLRLALTATDPSASPLQHALLATYLNIAEGDRISLNSIPKPAQGYEPVRPWLTDIKPTHHNLTGPLLSNHSLAPQLDDGSTAVATVYNRVYKPVKSCTNQQPVNESLIKFAVEFLTNFTPLGPLEPLTFEDYLATLPTTKRDHYKKAEINNLDSEIRAFLKREATGKTPRLISNFANPRFNAEFGRYCKPVSQLLSEVFPWYLPGSGPKTICARVATAIGLGAVAIDFTNFDASVTRWLHDTILFGTLYALYPHHHKDLDAFKSSLFPARANIAGLSYDPGDGIKSGAASTTLGNTLIHAFLHYAALRRTGHTKTQAFERLSDGSHLIYGDDGLLPKPLATTLTHTAQALGLEVTVTSSTCEATPFLGRIFNSSGASIQDPLRTLAKFHLSFANQPLRLAAASKYNGLLITDIKTPILSTLAARLYEHYSDSKTTRPTVFDSNSAWLSANHNEPWQEDYSTTEIRQLFCNHLGVSDTALAELEVQLFQLSIADLLDGTLVRPLLDQLDTRKHAPPPDSMNAGFYTKGALQTEQNARRATKMAIQTRTIQPDRIIRLQPKWPKLTRYCPKYLTKGQTIATRILVTQWMRKTKDLTVSLRLEGTVRLFDFSLNSPTNLPYHADVVWPGTGLHKEWLQLLKQSKDKTPIVHRGTPSQVADKLAQTKRRPNIHRPHTHSKGATSPNGPGHTKTKGLKPTNTESTRRQANLVTKPMATQKETRKLTITINRPAPPPNGSESTDKQIS